MSFSGEAKQAIEDHDLREHVRLLRAALEQIEWVFDGEVDRCPSCGMRSDVGHDWSCSTHAALTETKPQG